MMSSSSTNATPSASASRHEPRAGPAGTWTIASRRSSRPAPASSSSARFRLSDDEQRKRPRHVDRERRQHRQHRVAEERAERAPAGAARAPATVSDADAVRGERRQQLVRASAGRARRPARAPASRTAASCCAGVRPARSGVASPSSIACLRPATRTMKNSSRFDAAMAANLTRSSSGVVGVGRFLEHALVEREPGQLAVDEQRGRRAASAASCERPRRPDARAGGRRSRRTCRRAPSPPAAPS